MQESNSGLIKIIVGIVVFVIILIVLGFVLRSPANAPETVNDETSSFDNVSITTINSTSTVESDMDAYINAKSSNNPNDFNDSYSDLNQ